MDWCLETLGAYLVSTGEAPSGELSGELPPLYTLLERMIDYVFYVDYVCLRNKSIYLNVHFKLLLLIQVAYNI